MLDNMAFTTAEIASTSMPVTMGHITSENTQSHVSIPATIAYFTPELTTTSIFMPDNMVITRQIS